MVGDYAVTRVNLSMGTWHFPSNHWFFNKVVEYQKLLCVVLLLVSLHNHNDDDGNKNIKEVNDLINKTNSLNVQHTFFNCCHRTLLTL